MTRLRLCVFAAVMLLVPSLAHAQDDSWWAWIERLSGPGPFETKELLHIPTNWEVRLFCTSKTDQNFHFVLDKYGAQPAPPVPADPATGRQYTPPTTGGPRRPCLSNSSDVSSYIAVRYQLLSTGDQIIFGEKTPRDIGFRALEAFVRYRVHPAVDVGSGVGFLWLTDKSNDLFGTQSRGEIIPLSIILRPAAIVGEDNRWKRLFGIRVDQAYRFGTITSEQLGGAPGVFSVGGEWSFRWALIADIGVLIK